MYQPNIPKTLTLSFLAAAAILTVSACTAVFENPVPTTTTDKAEVHYPLSTTDHRLLLPESGSEVVPSKACPCCGFLSLEERGFGETCLVCFWKDFYDYGDSSEDEKPDDPTARNDGLTLKQAQKNFDSVGACSPEMKRFVLPADIVRGMKRSERTR